METMGEPGEGFKFLVGFMNFIYLHFAKTNTPTLVKSRLEQLYTSATCESEQDRKSIKFQLDGSIFTINSTIINNTLNIKLEEGESFKELANDEILEQFFKQTDYNGSILAKDKHLVFQW